MPPAEPQVFDFASALTDELVTHTNVKQELVVTTIDKLKLCLLEHKANLRSRREWVAPAGLLATLVTTQIATDFKAALGVEPATWEAIFLISSVLAAILLIFLLYRSYRAYSTGGIDSLVDIIADKSSGVRVREFEFALSRYVARKVAEQSNTESPEAMNEEAPDPTAEA